jgi:hypothetical protein
LEAAEGEEGGDWKAVAAVEAILLGEGEEAEASLSWREAAEAEAEGPS